MNCHACGAPLSASARFCHKCGAAVATARASGWRAGFPWAIAGAAVGALIAVVVMRNAAGRSGDAAADPTASSSRRPPDISQMSPQERADRLFNRVMILVEAGKEDSVRFFLPMAFGAYGDLPTLDADARYHLGLLELAGGNPAAALAQADTIQRAVPTHLFIYVLRAHAYTALGDQTRERRAYADFLSHEAAELAANRAEYGDHRDALTSFHTEAVRQTQSPRRSTS
jgi:hypothetical protein